MFSEKRTGLAEVGEKDIDAQSLCLVGLYNMWGGMKELLNLVGGCGMYSFKRKCDLLSICMGGGILTQIFILLQTTTCYLLWLEAVHQSYV